MSDEPMPKLMFEENWQSQSLHHINVITNIVSLISASIVLLILLAMRFYDRRLVDRVSLRLTAAISATDLISSSSLLVYSFTAYDDGLTCQLIVFLIVWLTNQYLFLTSAIAFNLQWLFLHKRYHDPSFEKWYYILSISLSLVTGIAPWAAQRLGYDQAQGVCWYTPSYSITSQIWEYGSYIVPQVLCCLYCIVIVTAVIYRLKRDARSNDKLQTHSTIDRIVRRVLMYLWTPALTQTGFIVSEIYMYQTSTISYSLNVWGVLTKALPGLFNLITFSMDPAFTSALKKLKKDLILTYRDDDFSDTYDDDDEDDDDDVTEKDSKTDPSRPNSMTQTVRSMEIHALKMEPPHFIPRQSTLGSIAPLAMPPPTACLSASDPPPRKRSTCLRWIVNKLWPRSRRSAQSSMSSSAASHAKGSPYRKKSGMTTSSTFVSATTVCVDENDLAEFVVQPVSKEPCDPHRMERISFPVPMSLEDLDEVVPWRVLEAREVEEEVPRAMSEPSDSWLELNEPASPSRVSQWFNKRSDSLDSVCERMARSSKSIRRWRRQQQQQQNQPPLSPNHTRDSYPPTQRQSRVLSCVFDPTILTAVRESVEEHRRDDRLQEAL